MSLSLSSWYVLSYDYGIHLAWMLSLSLCHVCCFMSIWVMIMAYILLECWVFHYVMSNVLWVFEFTIMVCFELCLLECWVYHYVMSNVLWVFEFIIMVCFELWLWHTYCLNVEFIIMSCLMFCECLSLSSWYVLSYDYGIHLAWMLSFSLCHV